MAALGRLLAMMGMVMLAISFNTAFAADPDMLQDICVADLNSAILVNGFPCKPNATPDDFFSDILALPGATNNPMGSNVTAANVMMIPGLNTLGVSMARVDFAPGGINPPHTHPRATEMLFLLQGELDVGFITTSNRLFAKHIKKGEVFVFPRGLVHFQKNNGYAPAIFIAGFNSQLPGVQAIAATLFNATPPVPDYVLAKSFMIGIKEVQKIKSRFAPLM